MYRQIQMFLWDISVSSAQLGTGWTHHTHPNHNCLEPCKSKFCRSPVQGAGRAMCSSLLKGSPKQVQLKMEIQGQITSATVAIQMCLSGIPKTNFFLRCLIISFPNLYDFFFFWYLLFKILEFFQIPSCSDRLIEKNEN